METHVFLWTGYAFAMLAFTGLKEFDNIYKFDGYPAVPLMEKSLKTYYTRLFHLKYGKNVPIEALFAYDILLLSILAIHMIFVNFSWIILTFFTLSAFKHSVEYWTYMIHVPELVIKHDVKYEEILDSIKKEEIVERQLHIAMPRNFYLKKISIDSTPETIMEEYAKLYERIKNVPGIQKEEPVPLTLDEIISIITHINEHTMWMKTKSGKFLKIFIGEKKVLDVSIVTFVESPRFRKLDLEMPLFFVPELFKKRKEIGMINERYAEAAIIAILLLFV